MMTVRSVMAFGLLAALLLMPVAAVAQHPLDGLWEGTMSNSLATDKGPKFELELKVERHRVKGRAFLHLPDGTVLATTVEGRIFDDQSVGLEDIRFDGPPNEDGTTPMRRKYQASHLRSIWDASLDGYWQEVREDPMHPTRKIGRFTLRRAKPGKV